MSECNSTSSFEATMIAICTEGNLAKAVQLIPVSEQSEVVIPEMIVENKEIEVIGDDLDLAEKIRMHCELGLVMGNQEMVASIACAYEHNNRILLPIFLNNKNKPYWVCLSLQGYIHLAYMLQDGGILEKTIASASLDAINTGSESFHSQVLNDSALRFLDPESYLLTCFNNNDIQNAMKFFNSLNEVPVLDIDKEGLNHNDDFLKNRELLNRIQGDFAMHSVTALFSFLLAEKTDNGYKLKMPTAPGVVHTYSVDREFLLNLIKDWRNEYVASSNSMENINRFYGYVYEFAYNSSFQAYVTKKEDKKFALYELLSELEPGYLATIETCMYCPDMLEQIEDLIEMEDGKVVTILDDEDPVEYMKMHLDRIHPLCFFFAALRTRIIDDDNLILCYRDENGKVLKSFQMSRKKYDNIIARFDSVLIYMMMRRKFDQIAKQRAIVPAFRKIA